MSGISGRGEMLGHRKEAAIAALLAKSNLSEAAASCGISDRTLRRWMRNKLFLLRYSSERAMMLDGIADVLKQSAVNAVRVLVSVAHSRNSPASARVSAATRILEFNFKSYELVAIEKRISQLEEIAQGKR
jgi:hypothetical protein